MMERKRDYEIEPNQQIRKIILLMPMFIDYLLIENYVKITELEIKSANLNL
jgi:hypothetical protein